MALRAEATARLPRRAWVWPSCPSLALALLAACGGEGGEAPDGVREVGSPVSQAMAPEAAAIVAREMARIEAAVASRDSIFQPLPLLRPAQEDALRRFGNTEQLARARALGIGRELPAARLAELEDGGRLVRLADSDYWVVRDLDYSQPLVVPGVQSLLEEIGRRFHARLAALGAPPFRMEVSSVLRTAADQAALRRVNPNAALGESAHEYGTTVDVLYSAYAAPATPIVDLDPAGAEWAAPFLTRFAEIAAERVAARRSLELKAILGEVLLEMQAEGSVMITLERLQPVYHMTLAR